MELATISDVHDVSSVAKIKSKICPVFLWQQLLGDLLVTQMSGGVEVFATFAVWVEISSLQRLHAVHRSLRFTAMLGLRVFLSVGVPAVSQVNTLFQSLGLDVAGLKCATS